MTLAFSNNNTLAAAYDGSNLFFQLMRCFGWSNFLNLGYCQPWDWLIYPARHDIAQDRLARKSIELLDVKSDQQVLDIACGRGRSSFTIAMTHPAATVVGLDYIPEQIAAAKFLNGNTRNLTYQTGDVHALPFESASFDRIHCLEAAFHFDRDRFLQEAYRVLKPGGKLVIVDFMWKDGRSRQLLDTIEGKICQEVWQFDDFWSVNEYHTALDRSGFRVLRQLDWTNPVTTRGQTRLDVLLKVMRYPFMRRFYYQLHPPLQYFSLDDWQYLRQCAQAYKPLRRASLYIALVVEKL